MEEKPYRASSSLFFFLFLPFSNVKTKEKPGGNEAKIRQEKKSKRGLKLKKRGLASLVNGSEGW